MSKIRIESQADELITVTLDTTEWIKVVVALDVIALRGGRDYKLIADKVESQINPEPEPAQWKWTCQECAATGIMPPDVLETPHDCKSRGPFDTIARLLVEPIHTNRSPR